MAIKYLTKKQANDKNLIRYLAEQVLPEKIQTISRLEGGVTSNSYEINHHLIFKLPGPRTPLERWEEQSQCAPVLQRHFFVQIPQPTLKNVFLSSSNPIPLLASTYEKITGYTIAHSKDFFKRDSFFKQKYFEQLAEFTHQLHTINPKGLPIQVPTIEEFLEKRFSQKIGGMTEKQKKLFESIIHSSRFKDNSDPQKIVLCHCDLRPANICLDKKNNIVGVLDFDSLNRGKSFMEFRPNLYGFYNNEADTKQFCHTYYQQTGSKDPIESFKNMRRMLTSLCALCVLFKCQNTLTRITSKLLPFIKHIKQFN